jgi:hypothetical protein
MFTHGNIKQHNILIENDSPIIDNSPADYSTSVLKLADFGLLQQRHPAIRPRAQAPALSGA